MLELGVLGTVLILGLFWRTIQDLLSAHLLGRAACPVGGGEAEGARRNDPFSVGLAVGALGGVLALLVHSLFDFAARIPANGVLAATCLGIATGALHTRFSPTGERLLTRVWVRPLGTGWLFAVTLGALAVVLSLALITVFGAVAPSVTPLLVPGLFGTTAAAFVPVQTLFGPAAFAPRG